MTSTKLLPLNTRVTHFDGGPHTHGKGTIVAYNSAQPIPYAEERLEDAAEIADSVGCLGVIVNSFFSGARCPYVVHFDPSVKFPEGYRDVYEADSLRPIVEN